MAYHNYYRHNYYGRGEEEKKELAYDLRQKLAELLGKLREEITIARLNRDYPRWINLLDSLYIELTKKLNEEEMDEYNKLLKKAVKIIKENPKAYRGELKLNEGDVIYNALREIDIWINIKMEKYDMFGSKWEEEGL